jgi:hypothetical protein
MKIHKIPIAIVSNNTKTKCGKQVLWSETKGFKPKVSCKWEEVTCQSCLNKKETL